MRGRSAAGVGERGLTNAAPLPTLTPTLREAHGRGPGHSLLPCPTRGLTRAELEARLAALTEKAAGVSGPRLRALPLTPAAEMIPVPLS
jgi:hypothetical protein